MDEVVIRQKMEKAIEVFKTDIATIRTGRAHPSLVENLVVSVYGGAQKLKLLELGTITVQDARMIIIQPWDVSIANEVKNGIISAGTGLTAVVDAGIIRISIPALTTEQRQEYVKLLNKKTEGIRVLIRNIRAEERHFLQEKLRGKGMSEDDFKREEEKLQKLTDEHIAEIEEIAKKKEEEILG